MRPYTPVRLVLAIAIAAVACATTAFARESFFRPAIGDLDGATPGLERIAVTEEGSVAGFSYEGNLLSGFPVWLDGFVPVSSPLIGNVVGDGLNEVVVVGRNDQNAYKIFVVSAQGQVTAQADVVGEVYYDPVIVPQNNLQNDDVLVANIDGSVQRFRYANDQLVGGQVFQLGAAAGLASVGADVVVNYPEGNNLEIYNEQNGVWARRSQFAMPSPILYPVTATDAGALLGVTRNGKLLSVTKATGEVQAGFPVDITGTALGSVTFAEMNADNAGKEILVNFADGSGALLRANGSVLQSSVDKHFMSLGLDAEDAASHASYSLVNAYVGSFMSQNISRLFSYLSRVRIPSAQIAGADINLSVNGTSQASGSTYVIGNVILNEARDVTVLVENAGESALSLAGPVTLGGADAALFSITTQPRLVIPAHGNSQLVVHFVAQSSGVKTAQVVVASNDPDEAQYTLSLRATVPSAANIIRDGDMEQPAINPNDWRSWGSAGGFSRSNVDHVSGTQSMLVNSVGTHRGFQQLSVPVTAGHKYRYSIKYKLVSGTFNTWLGIKSSNSDFEKKMATIVKFSNNWQTYSREFVVPANFVNDFRIMVTVRDGDGYIDDMVLEEIPNVPSPIIYDGDMEQEGLALWTYFGQPTVIETTTAEAHGGTQSMHIVSQANYGFLQNAIPLVSGHTYHLRMWYKNVGGTLLPRISTTSASEDFEFRPGNPLEPMLGNTNGQWVQYDRTFTTPAAYTGIYRVVFMQSNADFGPPYRNLPQGEVYVDDVSIEEVLPQ